MAAGVSGAHRHALAANMHVRLYREQPSRPRQCHRRLGQAVAVSGRRIEIQIAQSIDCQDAKRRRCLGKIQPELRIVGDFLAVRVVVHFEDDVGAGFDQLRAFLEPLHRGVPGLISEQQLPAFEEPLSLSSGKPAK